MNEIAIPQRDNAVCGKCGASYCTNPFLIDINLCHVCRYNFLHIDEAPPEKKKFKGFSIRPVAKSQSMVELFNQKAE